MKTAEEILNSIIGNIRSANRDTVWYADALKAMEEYAAQFRQSPSPSLSAEQEAREYADGVVRDYIDKGVIRGLNNIRDSSTAAYLAGKASTGDGWVRVEDGTPEDGKYVECFLSEKGFNATDIVISKYTSKYGFESASCVTHWRNLPTPPVK